MTMMMNVSQVSRDLKPKKIIVFHDGVSEGPFDMVLNKELSDLKNVVFNNTHQPKIALIAAQKRHKTQFFLENMADGGATGDVPPGTVVDTKIVHPFEFDFYPSSHFGRIGTRNCQEHFVQLDGYFSQSRVSEASGWLNLLLIFKPFA
ncbi:hypothetical protein CDL12_20765 [Handroanthus impetiginosus]|uniref:Piwi domain-containing protein n=1 Tax=Handroanthus impetiginosus TaxID=429701 RepID=A0A2G9GN17_9LAMI|nr:hypothetical protein CDL12_20765 [Handroanthus impetiginosus]